MGDMLQEAIGLLDEAKQLPTWNTAGMRSKQSVFGAALTAYARGGDYAGARRLFEDMKQGGVPVLHNHFNALLVACARVCDGATADNVFAEMQSVGLMPRKEDHTIRISCHRGELAM